MKGKKKKHNGGTSVNSKLLRKPIQRCFLLFLAPTFLAFCIGFIYPFLRGIYLSFCKFVTIGDASFVGFRNYMDAFNDASFIHAFWYTALYAIVSLFIINVLAFLIAYLLTLGIKGANLFRTAFFMPNLIGGIVLGYIWSMIFNGVLGKINTSILMETRYGFWGLIILMCWQQIGYMMIIYIAGLQAVPGELIEAAKIDGANHFQIFWKILLPNTKSSMATLGIYTFISAWNNLIWMLLSVRSESKWTVTLGISSICGASVIKQPTWNLIMGVIVIGMIPVLILFFAFQKYFMQSVAATGIK